MSEEKNAHLYIENNIDANLEFSDPCNEQHEGSVCEQNSTPSRDCPVTSKTKERAHHQKQRKKSPPSKTKSPPSKTKEREPTISAMNPMRAVYAKFNAVTGFSHAPALSLALRKMWTAATKPCFNFFYSHATRHRCCGNVFIFGLLPRHPVFLFFRKCGPLPRHPAHQESSSFLK